MNDEQKPTVTWAWSPEPGMNEAFAGVLRDRYPDGAPVPIITTEGPGSEHFYRTRRIRTIYSCPACAFHCGAEGVHQPASSLPPELRDAAAWRQEAEAQRTATENARLCDRARRTYDAHQCAKHAKP